MPVSVRLDKKTEELLSKAAKVKSVPKSKIMKESIKEYCFKIVGEKQQQSIYDRAKDLFGKEGSGRGDLSTRGEEILRETFKRKRHDRN
mgnify:CR=1 FL=1|jgi:predicted transcriptional regulator